MAFNQLKKWVGTQLWSTFMTEYNENVDELNRVIAELEANISLLKGLGKVEEIYIPAGTQTRFNIPPNSTRFFILTPNTDNKTFVMSVVRFSSANQYVKHILHDNADFSVAKNADGSAVFITPTYASRGLVITAGDTL